MDLVRIINSFEQWSANLFVETDASSKLVPPFYTEIEITVRKIVMM